MPEAATGARVTIGGYDHCAHAALGNVQFSDVNLLGADFCRDNGVSVLMNYTKSWVKLYFGEG